MILSVFFRIYTIFLEFSPSCHEFHCIFVILNTFSVFHCLIRIFIIYLGFSSSILTIFRIFTIFSGFSLSFWDFHCLFRISTVFVVFSLLFQDFQCFSFLANISYFAINCHISPNFILFYLFYRFLLLFHNPSLPSLIWHLCTYV